MADEEKLENGALHPRDGNDLPDDEEGDEEGYDEFFVGINEYGEVTLNGPKCELALSPEEARELGQALIDTADEAENPEELEE